MTEGVELDYTSIGATLVAVISSGFAIVQWAVGRHDKQAGITREEFQALKLAVIELAYMRLEDRHHRYMLRGWAHPNEKRICERLYSAYHSIGGNGTGTQMMLDIRALPNYDPHSPTPDDDPIVTD